MNSVTIQFGEVSAEIAQQLLDVYRKAKAPTPLEVLAAVGGVESGPAPATPQVTEVLKTTPDLPERTMREEIALFSERHGKDAVREVFAKLGVKKLGEVPVDWYPKLRALLDGAEA